jgi:hypothetical protein
MAPAAMRLVEQVALPDQPARTVRGERAWAARRAVELAERRVLELAERPRQGFVPRITSSALTLKKPAGCPLAP